MTATSQVRLWCDHEGCMLGGHFKNVSSSVSQVRQSARANGWTYWNGDDFCPEHKPTPEQMGPPCETCGRPRNIHVCIGCSPDRFQPGPGCDCCRHTGWNQTPCLPSGGGS